MSKESEALIADTQELCEYAKKRKDIIETILKDYAKQHQIDIDLLGTAYKANIQNEKKLKAFEIIKSRCEFDFIEEKINDATTRREIHIKPKNKEQLFCTCLVIFAKDQEEYDLLKEVLL